MAILCLMCGWSLRLWMAMELFMHVGLAGAGFSAFIYLLSRRTRLRVSLEDGTELQVAVRNKHFGQASRFANIVCRVCTHWEPRERGVIEPLRLTPSKAELQIEEDEDEEEDLPFELDPVTELDTDISAARQEEPLPQAEPMAIESPEVGEADEPTVEIRKTPAGWIKLQEPA
jgi:hypothetical protein